MAHVEINEPVPAFQHPATGGKTLSLADFSGHNLVLYFYPKDNTPGCTTEGREFRDLHTAFTKLNTAIVGVSRDSIKSHEKFKDKQGFPFALLSDEDESLCKQFGVLKEKNMFGNTVFGIERSTFLIDGEGVLREQWRKVRAKGHAAIVLEAVKKL